MARLRRTIFAISEILNKSVCFEKEKEKKIFL